MTDKFEWDDDKLSRNVSVHGIHFADAARIDWSTAQIAPDERFDYGEERSIVRGFIDGRLHILVFVMREERMRIISLRKANARERRNYAHETARIFGSS